MSSWVVEAIIQFIKSPLWTVPLNNFIDEHCVVFCDEDTGEMKNDYNTEYLAFQELIDTLLTSFMDELAVPADEVLQACKDRLDIEQASGKRNAYLTELIEYVTYLSDFRAFYSFMRKRNADLQVEMAEELTRLLKEKKTSKTTTSSSSRTETDEERELRMAIEVSLAEAQLAERRLESEDAELQKALALSLAAEEERLENQRKYLAECAAKADESRRKEAEEALMRLEAERAARIRHMEEETLQQRQEIVRQHQTKIAIVTPTSEAPAATSDTVVPPSPVAMSVATASAPPTSDVVHCSSISEFSTSSATTQPKALPDVGRRGGGFGFKALPSIQPTLKELTIQASDPHTATVVKPVTTAAAAQIHVNRKEPTPQEIEERAREMRELRAKMVEAKKASRNAELENYKNGVEATAPPSSVAVDPAKMVTVELARRLRADLIVETKKNISL